jgi:hypothetical protein
MEWTNDFPYISARLKSEGLKEMEGPRMFDTVSFSKSLFEKVDPAVPDGGQEEKHKLMKPQSILKTQPNAGKSKRVTVVDSKTSTFQTAS